MILIADDMTGMLDTAVQFAKAGIPTTAYPGKTDLEELKHCQASVIAVTTESRNASKEEAYQRVRDITEKAKAAGIQTVFKKTDSVLRGHLGADFEAILDAMQTKKLLFFPAYPAMERTTRNGIQYVNRVPVAESGFNTDQTEAISSSFIPEILAEETSILVTVIRSGETWNACGEKKQIYVFDAENETTLRKRAEEARTRGCAQIVAGCAGLAKELSEIMGDQNLQKESHNPNKTIFAVCGSMNRVTRSQVAYAAKHGYEYYPIGIDDLIDTNTKTLFYKEEIANAIRNACKQKKPVVIAPVCREKHSSERMNGIGVKKKIVDRLNEILLACMEKLEGYTLFHTGGDTLSSFVSISGCSRIELCGELYPGIAMNRFRFGRYEKYVISKSGGFGDEDVLVKCLGNR